MQTTGYNITYCCSFSFMLFESRARQTTVLQKMAGQSSRVHWKRKTRKLRN